MNYIISAIVGAIVTKVIDIIWDIRKHMRIWFMLLFNRNERVRISCAYLFRIKSDNKYLLIKNKRIDQFQPVGGVYKYYESFKDESNKLGLTFEKNDNFYEKNDLRVYVPAKKVLRFIKWFNSGKNREINVTREFYEELIKTEFLSQNVVFEVHFEYIKQNDCKLKKSEHFGCKEILIHNIYDVSFNNKEDLRHLEESVENNGKQLIFVNSADIERGAVNIDGCDMKIGEHTKEIL